MTAPTWRELSEATSHVLDAGGVVPCRTGSLATTRKWTSSDPTEQREAAEACRGCVALSVCADYIAAHPTEAGVYAGLTEADRKPRVGRPKKSKEDQR